MSIVSPELLRRLLDCDYATGRLFWRSRTPDLFAHCRNPEARCASFNSQFAGNEAFTAENKGYRVGRIFDEIYQAHRVVFAHYHGAWPVRQVDHIDGNPLNNCVANLRDVSNAENHRNERRSINNTSGACGVSFHRANRKWRAHIKVDYRQIHLGMFASKEEAIAARKDAERRYGFHLNHGAAR